MSKTDGGVHHVGRYCVSIEIHDNATHRDLYADGFNTPDTATVVLALRKAIEAVKAQGAHP